MIICIYDGGAYADTATKKMLSVLIDHFEDHDVPPSFEELCAALDLKSKSGIHRLLSGLEERGYIRRLPNRARAIEVVKYPDGTAMRNLSDDKPQTDQHPQEENMPDQSIPFLGKIAAGTPIDAISDPTRFVAMPHHLMGRGDYYALEIEGIL